MTKKYYWLKLKENFFMDKRIKKLRKISGGDTFTIIYLKMQLLSIKNEGKLFFENVEDSFEKEIALEIDEDVDNVKITIMFLLSNGLLEQIDENSYILSQTIKCIGSECDSANRVRKFREKQKELKKIELDLIDKEKMPYIDEYNNNYRYSGNYFLVVKRDNYKCVLCNSTENLCVHHIDGFDSNKPENNKVNKLITVCRSCHKNIHLTGKIDENILKSINYYDECNATVTQCNATVTKCNTDIDIDIDIDKNIDIYIDKEKKENIKRKKEKIDIIGVVNQYTLNEDLRKELITHFENRKTGKNKLTNRAIELSLNKLDKLTEKTSNDLKDNHKIAIVQQTLEYGWIGFFELKKNSTKSQNVNWFDEIGKEVGIF